LRRAIRYITRVLPSAVRGWFRFYPSRFGRASPAHKVFLLSNICFLLGSAENLLSSYFLLLSSAKNLLSSYFLLLSSAKNLLSSYFLLLSSAKNLLSSYFLLTFGAAEWIFGAAK
jgi:hypothetical protein